MEEGKESILPSRANQSRVLPQRMLKILVLFLGLCIAFSLISVYMIKHSGFQSIVPREFLNSRPCVEEPNNLDRWIKPPSNLIHTMSDSELFWRATFLPRIKKYPFRRIPKVAFMFLTKGSLPLAPLWERYFKGHEGLYSIYVHSLPNYHDNFPASSVFYKRQIPSQVCF